MTNFIDQNFTLNDVRTTLDLFANDSKCTLEHLNFNAVEHE